MLSTQVQVFDTHSGQALAQLRMGHYDAVTACVYAPNTGRLWSAGLDGAVLAWEPRPQKAPAPQATTGHALDAWLAAAACGRGSSSSSRLQAAGTAGNTSRAATRAPLPDIDFWSDDEATMIGS
jgi:hypothetical protein